MIDILYLPKINHKEGSLFVKQKIFLILALATCLCPILMLGLYHIQFKIVSLMDKNTVTTSINQVIEENTQNLSK